tara:strand:- start:5021 stop:6760 length:1740 start_codon:yes stop_codon:yes gene_type:complete
MKKNIYITLIHLFSVNILFLTISFKFSDLITESQNILYEDILRVGLKTQAPLFVIVSIGSSLIFLIITEFTFKRLEQDKKLFTTYIYYATLNGLPLLASLTLLKFHNLPRSIIFPYLLLAPLLYVLFEYISINQKVLIGLLTFGMVISFIYTGRNLNNVIDNREEAEYIDETLIDITYIEKINNDVSFAEAIELSKKIIWTNRLVFDKYKIDLYSLCCKQFAYNAYNYKPGGYIDVYKDNLIFVNNAGNIVNIDLSSFERSEKNYSYNIIQSNINEIIQNKNVFINNQDYSPENFSAESIRDILIYKENIYLSFYQEKTKDCLNIEIISAPMSLEFINFEEFFAYDECISKSDSFEIMGFGGRIVTDGESIYFTTGWGGDFFKTMDEESYFGKIFQIDIRTREEKILSKGHKNQQGLFYVEKINSLIFTEHGPISGDEINLLEIDSEGVKNYGWPYSTYGNHYVESLPDDLIDFDVNQKNHEEFGYIEPLYYFHPSKIYKHGISEIIGNSFSENSFFIGTMKGLVLYDMTLNKELNEVVTLDGYRMPDRIRDFAHDKENNRYFILFDSGPSLGVLVENK